MQTTGVQLDLLYFHLTLVMTFDEDTVICRKMKVFTKDLPRKDE